VRLIDILYPTLKDHNTQTAMLWRLFINSEKITLLEEVLQLYCSQVKGLKIKHDENMDMEGELKRDRAGFKRQVTYAKPDDQTK
jgi:hypothetical protein